MRSLPVFLMTLQLTACAGSLRGLDRPMHVEGDAQVGWEEATVDPKNDDGSHLFVVKSAGNLPYAELVEVAERHAAARCPFGYRVLSLDGGDQPQVDTLKPRFILASEVRFKVKCFARDNI